MGIGRAIFKTVVGATGAASGTGACVLLAAGGSYKGWADSTALNSKNVASASMRATGIAVPILMRIGAGALLDVTSWSIQVVRGRRSKGSSWPSRRTITLLVMLPSYGYTLKQQLTPQGHRFLEQNPAHYAKIVVGIDLFTKQSPDSKSSDGAGATSTGPASAASEKATTEDSAQATVNFEVELKELLETFKSGNHKMFFEFLSTFDYSSTEDLVTLAKEGLTPIAKLIEKHKESIALVDALKSVNAADLEATWQDKICKPMGTSLKELLQGKDDALLGHLKSCLTAITIKIEQLASGEDGADDID